MIKKEFSSLEESFCQMFDIQKKDSTALDKYEVMTVNGVYKVWFDYNGIFSIFGKFDDIDKVIEKPIDGFKKINPYSGKMNFHGAECHDFIQAMDYFKIP